MDKSAMLTLLDETSMCLIEDARRDVEISEEFLEGLIEGVVALKSALLSAPS
jgi:hypothetical protein